MVIYRDRAVRCHHYSVFDEEGEREVVTWVYVFVYLWLAVLLAVGRANRLYSIVE